MQTKDQVHSTSEALWKGTLYPGDSKEVAWYLPSVDVWTIPWFHRGIVFVYCQPSSLLHFLAIWKMPATKHCFVRAKPEVWWNSSLREAFIICDMLCTWVKQTTVSFGILNYSTREALLRILMSQGLVSEILPKWWAWGLVDEQFLISLNNVTCSKTANTLRLTNSTNFDQLWSLQ